MKRFAFVVMVGAAVLACGGSAKKQPGPGNVHGKTQKPASAQDMGKVTSVTPPGATGAPTIATKDPSEEWAWQEDIDDDGNLDDCLEAIDDVNGDLLLACAPYRDTCDDGTAINGAIFILQHADGTGVYGLAASDVCGAGSGIFGCNFDANGDDTGCGGCVVGASGDFTCSSDAGT